MSFNNFIVSIFLSCLFLILDFSLFFQAEKLYQINCSLREELSCKEFLIKGVTSFCNEEYFCRTERDKDWCEKKDSWIQLCNELFCLENLTVRITKEGYVQSWKKDGKEYMYEVKILR